MVRRRPYRARLARGPRGASSRRHARAMASLAACLEAPRQASSMSSNLVERISTLTHTVRCTGLASFVTYQPLREVSLVFFVPQLGGTSVGTLPRGPMLLTALQAGSYHN